MRVETHAGRVPDDAAAALEEFEREFTYPLGDGCRFRISHGTDYLNFFRAMGEAALVLASENGQVTGSLVRVRRQMILKRQADSADETVSCHYLGDLKVRTDCRGGSVLARLFRETKRQILASDTHACYGVVMGGTGRLPTDYTGRVGVPAFEKLGEIVILRLVSGNGTGSNTCRVVDAAEMHATAQAMDVPGYRCMAGNQGCRSLMPPVHLATCDGSASGRLEDTRAGKRLFFETGEEMVSAHLGGFIYQNPESAGLLLKDAAERARLAHYPALFCAFPAEKIEELRGNLAGMDVTEAPATVYGVGMETGPHWWMDTAEI